MRVTLRVAILVVGIVAGAFALPANPRKDDVEIIPSRHSYGGAPIVDTGVVSYEPFGSNPFGGLFENIEGVMTRMRQQMEALFRNIPGVGRLNDTSSGEDDDFPGFGGFAVPAFPPVDLSKGNTTSVTKIINGHKVVINETDYSKDDDLGGTYFHVRIIDVKPEDEGKGAESTTVKDVAAAGSSRDHTSVNPNREPLGDSVENEIPQGSREAARFQNLETFDDVNGIESFETNDLAEGNSEWGHPISIDRTDNSLYNHLPIDLSRDTYVNQILAESGAPTNPDAEVIDVRQIRNAPPMFYRRK